MSSGSSPNLVLELRGFWLRHAPAFLLLLVALSVPWFLVSWSPTDRLLCGGAGLAAAIFSIWRLRVFQPALQLSRWSWDQEHSWQLQFSNDNRITATLVGRSWLTPVVICFKFRIEDGRHYQFLLWRNQLTRQAWHQWSLRLHQEGGHDQKGRNVGSAIKVSS